MGSDSKIEIKQFDNSATLKALAAKSNTNVKDAYLDDKELSIFRGYVRDAEFNGKLTNNDKEALKSIMGFTPNARSLDTPVFHSDKEVEAYSEQSQAREDSDAYKQLRAAFDKARGYDAKNNTYAKTIDEAYKAVKDNPAFKGKEYKEALKQLKYDRKHSIADAEAQEVRRRASLAVDDKLNIVNESALKLQDEDDVRDAQIEYIKTQNDGKIDTRVKKALRNKNQSAAKNFGLWFSGNYSAGKQDDISVAALNKAAVIANKKYNKEEVLGIVGSEEMLKNFMDAKLVSYDEKTKQYNIKNLSLLFLNSIGADATINEHDVDVQAETQAFRNKLHFKARDNGLDLEAKDITNEQILDLGTNLGYYDNHYHGKFVRTWQKTTQGLAKGAIIGGIASARRTNVNADLEQHQEVSINMADFTPEERQRVLDGIKVEGDISGVPVTAITGEGEVQTTIGKLTETVTGIYLSQDQILNVNISKLWKHVALGAAIGGLVGAGMGVIEGLTSKGSEKECFGLTDDCDNIKTYEDMVAYIDKAYPNAYLKPEQKEALKKIALLGYMTEWVVDEKTGQRYERFVQVKDDKGDCKPVWDWCTFLSNYNRYRGNQIFNTNELRMASALTKNRLQTVKTEDCPPEQKQVVPPAQPKQETAEVLWAEEITPEDNLNVHGHSWDSLAKLYDCFPKDINKAKRMLKVMQGMQGEKLTIEQITDLADTSFKEVHIRYLRDSKGEVDRDKYGNPKYDIEGTARQLEAAFKNKLPKGYKFNYMQCAIALCAPVPGDDKNMIVAPKEMPYEDKKQTPCKRQDVRKPKASHDKAEVGNRGNAGKVGNSQRAVKDGKNPVQRNEEVSDELLRQAKEIGHEDKKLLKRK